MLDSSRTYDADGRETKKILPVGYNGGHGHDGSHLVRLSERAAAIVRGQRTHAERPRVGRGGSPAAVPTAWRVGARALVRRGGPRLRRSPSHPLARPAGSRREPVVARLGLWHAGLRLGPARRG